MRVRLRGPDGPLAGEQVTLQTTPGRDQPLTTDGDGVVQLDMRVLTTVARLSVGWLSSDSLV